MKKQTKETKRGLGREKHQRKSKTESKRNAKNMIRNTKIEIIEKLQKDKRLRQRLNIQSKGRIIVVENYEKERQWNDLF